MRGKGPNPPQPGLPCGKFRCFQQSVDMIRRQGRNFQLDKQLSGTNIGARFTD
jgi:hypothetical protein